MIIPSDIIPAAIYPIGEAAKLIGMSPRNLLRLATAGKIKYSLDRRTARKRFKGSELLRFLGI